MRALVMAAGLGTRLRPLTDTLPKPLVPLHGRPLVERVLRVLERGGITDALINIHYLPEKMRAFVDEWNGAGRLPRLHVQDESAEILGSGGAVALAAGWLFENDSCALICNSDVILDPSPDLKALAEAHRAHVAKGVECTLTAIAHPEAGIKYNGLRREGELITGFEQDKKHDPGLWLFPGYYVLEKKAAGRLPPAGTVFSVYEELWKKLAAERKLGAFELHGRYFDLGTVKDLEEAAAALKDS